MLLLMHRARKLLLIRDELHDARLLFSFELENDLFELLKAMVQVDFTLTALVRARLAYPADWLFSTILMHFIL